MFWQEDTVAKTVIIPDNVQDLLFSIQCKMLPVDHIYPLSQAINQALPWLKDEALSSIHEIYISPAGNGWNRPDDVMYLSRRTHLILRIPKQRIEDAKQLSNKTLDITGHTLKVGKAKTRLLNNLPTLFCHHITFSGIENMTEEQFLSSMAKALKQKFDLNIKKMLCGKSNTLQMDANNKPQTFTRSLMIADLAPEESILLQENGYGNHKHLGCGIFLPHKGIKAVNAESTD